MDQCGRLTSLYGYYCQELYFLFSAPKKKKKNYISLFLLIKRKVACSKFEKKRLMRPLKKYF